MKFYSKEEYKNYIKIIMMIFSLYIKKYFLKIIKIIIIALFICGISYFIFNINISDQQTIRSYLVNLDKEYKGAIFSSLIYLVGIYITIRIMVGNIKRGSHYKHVQSASDEIFLTCGNTLYIIAKIKHFSYLFLVAHSNLTDKNRKFGVDDECLGIISDYNKFIKDAFENNLKLELLTSKYNNLCIVYDARYYLFEVYERYKEITTLISENMVVNSDDHTLVHNFFITSFNPEAFREILEKCDKYSAIIGYINNTLRGILTSFLYWNNIVKIAKTFIFNIEYTNSFYKFREYMKKRTLELEKIEKGLIQKTDYTIKNVK